jgi:hypothetical protein
LQVPFSNSDAYEKAVHDLTVVREEKIADGRRYKP